MFYFRCHRRGSNPELIYSIFPLQKTTEPAMYAIPRNSSRRGTSRSLHTLHSLHGLHSLYSLSGGLYWLSVVLYVLVTSFANLPVVSSQYSSHCHFNQLCSCRVVPVKRNSNGAGNYGESSFTSSSPSSYNSRVTNPTYTGQFGILIPE